MMVAHVNTYTLRLLNQVLELVNFCPIFQHEIQSMCGATLFGNVGVCRDNVIHGPKHIHSIVCANLSHEPRTNILDELLQFCGNVCLRFLVPSRVNGALKNVTRRTR
jgi:hypothetical protein